VIAIVEPVHFQHDAKRRDQACSVASQTTGLSFIAHAGCPHSLRKACRKGSTHDLSEAKDASTSTPTLKSSIL